MLSRIYYWIEGAPEDRPGGPWWYQDFVMPRVRDDFVKGFKPFCHKIMKLTREGLSDMPIHFPEKDKSGPPDIYPPSDAIEL